MAHLVYFTSSCDYCISLRPAIGNLDIRVWHAKVSIFGITQVVCAWLSETAGPVVYLIPRQTGSSPVKYAQLLLLHTCASVTSDP